MQDVDRRALRAGELRPRDARRGLRVVLRAAQDAVVLIVLERRGVLLRYAILVAAIRRQHSFGAVGRVTSCARRRPLRRPVCPHHTRQSFLTFTGAICVVESTQSLQAQASPFRNNTDHNSRDILGRRCRLAHTTNNRVSVRLVEAAHRLSVQCRRPVRCLNRQHLREQS
jgi:hypothetical protein